MEKKFVPTKKQMITKIPISRWSTLKESLAIKTKMMMVSTLMKISKLKMTEKFQEKKEINITKT